jgi:hypothetical protein
VAVDLASNRLQLRMGLLPVHSSGGPAPCGRGRSPTKAFPHPLATLPYRNRPSQENWYSYMIVDEIMYMGIRGAAHGPLPARIL